MFRNFLIIAFRNFWRQKNYHVLNFAGLTLGLSCCALALLYVHHETSFDDFHPEASNTYRFAGKRTYGPWIPSLSLAYTHALMDAPTPEIKEQVRMRRTPSRYTTVGNQKYGSNRTFLLEPGSAFFKVFGHEVITGNKESMLAEPNAAVITASLAQKYFGTTEVLGQTMKYDSLLVKVTGVVADMPTNTHFDFDMLVTHPTYLHANRGGAIYYATLHEQADAQAFAEKIQAMSLGIRPNDSLAAVKAQPVESIHLHSDMTFELEAGGNPDQLWLFSAIALIILFISITNYTNLSSAIYSKRNEEMAVRKIFGSSRVQLSLQFLVESILLALLTLPFVIFAVEFTLPFFSNFIGFELTNAFLNDLYLAVMLLGIALLVGILAGIYPALVLPKHSILSLLKKQSIGGKVNLRRIMITGQFVMLIGLGSMAWFANRQLQYMNSIDTGINVQGVIKLPQAWSLEGVEKIAQFKNRLYENPSIEAVSQGYVPGDDDYTMTYQPEGSDVTLSDALRLSTDHDYFQTLGIEGQYGPYFSEADNEHPASSLLVNEAFVKNLGWDDPIGKRINIRTENPEPVYREIRGVFKDFNFYSLHQGITPMMLFANSDKKFVSQNLLIKINSNNVKATTDYILQTWDEFVPDSPITHEFVEQDMDKAYAKDQNTARLSTVLSGIAIIMAILGLSGLTAFITELKTKEIGIRKVLGAPLSSLLLGFSKEYLNSLIIATLLSGTASYFIISAWLDNFAYHPPVNLFVFLIAGLAVLLITTVTVCIQSLKVARKNPIHALKYE